MELLLKVEKKSNLMIGLIMIKIFFLKVVIVKEKKLLLILIKLELEIFYLLLE